MSNYGMTTKAIGKDHSTFIGGATPDRAGARPYHVSEGSSLRLRELKILAQNHIFGFSAGRSLPIALQDNFKPDRVPAQPGPPKRKK